MKTFWISVDRKLIYVSIKTWINFFFHWAQWSDRMWTGIHASIKTCVSAMVGNLDRDHSSPSIDKHRKWHNTKLVICFSMFSLRGHFRPFIFTMLLKRRTYSYQIWTAKALNYVELFPLVWTCLNLSLQNWQARTKIPSQNSIIYTSNTTV